MKQLFYISFVLLGLLPTKQLHSQNKFTKPDHSRGAIGIIILPFHDLTEIGHIYDGWDDAMFGSISKFGIELRKQGRYNKFITGVSLHPNVLVNVIVEVEIHKISIDHGFDLKFPEPSSWVVADSAGHFKYAATKLRRETKTTHIEGIVILRDFETCRQFFIRRIKAQVVIDKGEWVTSGDVDIIPHIYGGPKYPQNADYRPDYKRAEALMPSTPMDDSFAVGKGLSAFTFEVFRQIQKFYMDAELRRAKR